MNRVTGLILIVFFVLTGSGLAEPARPQRQCYEFVGEVASVTQTHITLYRTPGEFLINTRSFRIKEYTLIYGKALKGAWVRVYYHYAGRIKENIKIAEEIQVVDKNNPYAPGKRLCKIKYSLPQKKTGAGY